MLASDRPARGWIGQDDQIQPLERLRRYAAAPTGPDAGAALLGRARFRRRQRRVRPRRLPGAGMAAMASPRHDGDVGDAVHSINRNVSKCIFSLTRLIGPDSVAA